MARPRPLRVLAAGCLAAALAWPAGAADAPSSPLAFTLDRIDGTPQPLEAWRGQVLLLVNVASRCGLTPQYEGLEALYDRYRERGFAVLGFPANDFAGQEPGSNEEIAEFCRATYSVEFPLFGKIHVKGPEQHPLYAMLTGLPEPLGGPVEWNFQKYLVDREGRVVARFAPRTDPLSPELVGRLEALLAVEPGAGGS
jgi:glutathione peroxidase